MEEFLKPPLARFAQLHDRIEPVYRQELRAVLEISEGFAARLADSTFRETAESVSDRRQLEAIGELRSAREDAGRLQKALEAIFFDSHLLGARSRHYLSF